MNEMTPFLDFLREFFEIRGIKSIMQFTAAIDVNYITVCNWMNGKSYPSVANVIKVADYFNCSTDYLFELSKTEHFERSKTPSRFSERFINLSRASHLSDNRIAKDAGCSSTAVAIWRYYGQTPQIVTLVRLTDVLNCSLDYLIGRSDSL